MSGVDAALFRQLCGRFTTGVVVVSAAGPDGGLAGMTANSFTSVSLDPPLVSVNIERITDFHPIITGASQFVINVLATDQEAISRRFAAPITERLEGLGYRISPRGGFILDGVIAAIECERYALFAAGDHTIVVGRVVGGESSDGHPLLYFRGGYHTLG